MARSRSLLVWAVVVFVLAPAVLVSAAPAPAEGMKLVLPQGRTAFQTNEQIDVSAILTDKAAIPAGELTLTLTGEGSKLAFKFPLNEAPVADGAAVSIQHLHINGWLLRPGKYTLEAASGAAVAKQDIEVFSAIRKSTYRTIHWGGPSGVNMIPEGEDGMGFNLIMGGVDEPSIRAKVDIMGTCVMGGMHQHDGKQYCDWSDPYVYIGAIQRGMDRALSFRTMPNAIGAHLHDEPGLTWMPHPHMKGPDGKPLLTDFDVAPQRAAYLRAFGIEQPWADQIDTKNPAQLAAWEKLNDFKLGFMDAFWKASDDSINRIKPGFLAVTQSQYGWTALYDGYYFNVARSLPVISGHGGYNDFGPRNMNPSFFLEFAMPRQLDKPNWYLPEWGDCTTEQFRLEQYMSFITGIQGISSPPGLNIKSRGAPGIVETNKVMARLGTIFVKPAYTPAPLAVLYSKSDSYFKMKNTQFSQLAAVYLATKMIQQPISVVLEEDILDGTLAADHKAILITGLEYLDPAVVAALADYAKAGGVVLVTDDVKVEVPGAIKTGFAVEDYFATVAAKLKPITDAKAKQAESAKLSSFDAISAFVQPMAKALKECLAKNKIAPAFGCDSMTIAAGRQVRGEIEYIFAVNFAMNGTPEPGGAGQPAPSTATITLADDGRPVLDVLKLQAVQGATAKVEFGPGEMKVFARPARPIGGVTVGAPTISRDLTRQEAPVQMTLSATLLDKDNHTLSGTAPLQITVKDPAGAVRYDLFRATENGMCLLTLPLAANDPAGKWTVTVQELLSGTQGQAAFEYQGLTTCRAMAGATRRAVYFGDDKANIYRFFRDQRNVSIVIGKGDYDKAAAERLQAALKPYNVACTIVNAADVKSRDLTADEAKTWCGTTVAGMLKTGRENDAKAVGFDLANPAIVLGTPEDNPLLALMKERNVLPYKAGPDFPGRGRGMLAWNLHTLGHDVQAVACIGYDAAGMAEAAGTLFELAAGLDPLTPLAMPASAVIEAAK